MLRAIANVYIESHALSRRDGFKIFRVCSYSNATANEQTVLSGERSSPTAPTPPTPPTPPTAPTAPTPPTAPPPRPRRAWPALAALAVGASLGGVYFYRKLNDERSEENDSALKTTADGAGGAGAVPARAELLPAHAQFLLVGGGTAAFAAMRAIRSARPDAQVLIVGDEPALPYMRPPLSKELWREPELAARAERPDELAFRQWNGRRRSLAYEPEAFYAPPGRMREGGAGAALARGWRVVRLEPARHEAELAAGGERHVLTYGKVLLATGARARRLPALREARAAGRALALRGVRDAARLARALDDPAVRTVAVVGGGFLASELTAALAERLRGSGRRVVQVFRERAPLAQVLPPYLAADAARRLAGAGAELVAGAEVVGGAVADGRVALALSTGARLGAELVLECVGAEPAAELARGAGLELHEALGGVLVNAELQARSDVFAAGDVACFYDEALGRRRVEHHDHAVVSGRLAGENMAGERPPRPYAHQSMFWSDLGPQLGYEAIGIVDSRLRTVGVFSADAVGGSAESRGAAESAERREAAEGAERREGAEGRAASDVAEAERRFERGVVFYLRDERVVGVLLWNLFNRMHVARQVLARGEFDDLLEAAKLFAPHEED